MSVHPVLIDSRPPYIGRRSRTPSLLLLPIGTETLLGHVTARLADTTAYRPVVIPPADLTPAYQEQVTAAARGVRVLESPAQVADLMTSLEPSDTLLLVDPRCFPVEGLDPQALLAEAAEDPRWATHFVSLGGAGAGTREYADIDQDGRVRRVRRYYESVTWPFIGGVAACVLPVSALLGETLEDLALTRLRGRLATRGVPARDVLLPGAAVDLHDEAGLLALIDRHVRRSARAQAQRGPLLVGSGQQVHRAARLVGPVVVHRDAVVEERALVMGPTVLGAGARVGRGAIIAQSIVAAGCTVPAGARVHHRTVFDDLPALPAPGRRVAPGDELVRVHAGRALGGDAAAAHALHGRQARAGDHVRRRAAAAAGAADGGDRAAGGARLEGADLLRPRARGQGREALPLPEVPLHAAGRAGARARAARPEPGRRAAVQARPRPASHARGAGAAADEPRRDPAADQRGARRDGPRRPAALTVQREPALRALAPGPAFVRPGITGLWQVCRHDRSEGDFHQWIEYDLLYVRHMSLLLDLRILVATFVSMGGQKPVPISWVLPAAAAGGPPTPSRSAA